MSGKLENGYDRQSVLSAAGKLSCNRTALKRCTNTEIRASEVAGLSSLARVEIVKYVAG